MAAESQPTTTGTDDAAAVHEQMATAVDLDIAVVDAVEVVGVLVKVWEYWIHRQKRQTWRVDAARPDRLQVVRRHRPIRSLLPTSRKNRHRPSFFALNLRAPLASDPVVTKRAQTVLDDVCYYYAWSV